MVIMDRDVVTDDSFKRPGAVPFKWEIRPGAPKPQQQQQGDPADDEEPASMLLTGTTTKLSPPPAAVCYASRSSDLDHESSCVSKLKSTSKSSSNVSWLSSAGYNGLLIPIINNPLVKVVQKNKKKNKKDREVMDEDDDHEIRSRFNKHSSPLGRKLLSRWSRSYNKNSSHQKCSVNSSLPLQDLDLTTSPSTSFESSPQSAADTDADEWAAFARSLLN